MNIRFFVRTTGERDLSEFNKLSNVEFLYDREHKPVESFIKQLNIISEYNSVLLEDDVILCEDFEKKIIKAISEYPNDIINFFSSPEQFYSTHYTEKFHYNQCTYYPKGIALTIANEMNKVRFNLPNCRQYDILEFNALRRLQICHVVYRPCLVQHKDISSLLSNGSGRWSIYYEDYINKLGIEYREAYNRKNDLTKLLQEDIHSWEKEV